MAKEIKQSYLIHAPVEEVWKALVLPAYIDAWGGGPAKMTDEAGAKFSLWGGSIWGTNKEVVANKKLVQEWYSDDGGKWEAPSVVTFTLTAEDGAVRLDLEQINVPEESVQGIADGWKDFYLGPLKEYLEEETV
jgi:uncharacterized protein YndB with AHSA1/START domain